jgi:hypothetical protein
LTLQSDDPTPSTIGRRRFDPIAAFLFLVGALMLLWISRLDFRKQDANWDLLNYHAYDPLALLRGYVFTDFHPAGVGSYLTPIQDLLWWPLLSGVPAPIATAVLVAIQVSIFIPVGLVIQTLVPAISRPRALALGLMSVSGSMMMTELGTTMGDIAPAILLAWALWLLLSTTAPQTVRPERRAVIAGLLVGGAVALKFTVVYLFPGLLVFVIAMAIAGKRRSAALFFLASATVAIILCAPWAILLQAHMGSPTFPLFNGIFHAPRVPAVNMGDSRFPLVSILDLVKLPIRQVLGTAHTAEMDMRDTRWFIAFVAVGLAMAAIALEIFRRGTRAGWRTSLPALTLMVFWCVSYVTWAFAFGNQRYAMLLEVLALPIIVVGFSLALPRLPTSRAALPMLLLLAVFLAGTTRIIDFGRRPMNWAPVVPSQTIEPLTRYDAILVGAGPLASLRAVTRDAPGSSSQIWLGEPFNDVDRALERQAIAGMSVGVIFDSDQHDAAAQVASSLGLQMTNDCANFVSPLYNLNGLGLVVVCSASPAP